MDTEYLRENLLDILPKSQHSKIDKIIELVTPEPWSVWSVDVGMSRAAIETVEAYGLTIGVDANGDAATVEFPYGADLSE